VAGDTIILEAALGLYNENSDSDGGGANNMGPSIPTGFVVAILKVASFSFFSTYPFLFT
jgi:hypothetical protein